jgi:hypothetical protein
MMFPHNFHAAMFSHCCWGVNIHCFKLLFDVFVAQVSSVAPWLCEACGFAGFAVAVEVE